MKLTSNPKLIAVTLIGLWLSACSNNCSSDSPRAAAAAQAAAPTVEAVAAADGETPVSLEVVDVRQAVISQ